MIVAHFFLRNVRGKSSLYLETTSSQGLEQPSPAAQFLVEVDPKENRRNWIKKGYYAFVKKFPGLVLVDALENTIRLESDHPSFDLVFRPKSLRVGLVDELKGSTAEDASVVSVIKSLFSKRKEK